MSFYTSLAFGFCAGVLCLFGFRYLQQKRSAERIQRAIDNAMLTCMNKEDLRKLIPKTLYPSWVQFPEMEKVKWLNLQLKELWPKINEAASTLVREQLEPVLEMYRPPILAALELSKFTLGTVCPKIGGIQVVQDTGPDQVVLLLDLQWGGNPSIILAIRTLVGVTLQVQLKDFQFWGTFRIALTPLVSELPCFGAIIASLVSKPHLNWTSKVGGGDISSIPGLKSKIEDAIHSAITDSLVWPARILVPIVPGDYKHLELHTVGILEVQLVEASGLPNPDIHRTIDPRAKLFVRPIPSREVFSETQESTRHPLWAQTFEMEVEDTDSQRLVVQVFDCHDLIGDVKIGEAALPLKELQQLKLQDMWLPLVKDVDDAYAEEVDLGKVHLELLYRPLGTDGQPIPVEGLSAATTPRTLADARTARTASATPALLRQHYVRGVLLVTIISGKDLVACDLNGFSDPFVVLQLFRRPSEKRKTRVLRKTLNPEWNETFELLVEDAKNDMLVIEAYDHDLLGKKDKMGWCAVTMTKAVIEKQYEADFPLEDVDHGSLRIKLQWTPVTV